MPYRPPSNKDIGLQIKLNQEADKHNGQKYNDFLFYIETGVNTSNMAKIFGVNSNTMAKWLKLHKEEQANGQS